LNVALSTFRRSIRRAAALAAAASRRSILHDGQPNQPRPK
jgi:hypothetical protein